MQSLNNDVIALEKKFWQSMVDEDTETALSMLAEPSLMISSKGTIKFDHDEFRLVQNSIIVAGLLFIFGIAMPLSFLRVSNGTNEMLSLSEWLSSLWSVKGFFLFIVTAIFLYILAIFWRVSQRMEFKAEDIARLRNDTDEANYSTYLAVRADNKHKKRTGSV